ncbi:hypothetical protein ACO0DA_05910 [Bacillus subtilis]|uniref:hypothetical protein n=1 Tax=Bacillus subtilis TaxID=1423 RepID=UPI002DBD6ABC|nr:hypothetical protein [Bacillus subtilis]MEC0400792.1 hypothetical protein [Bacillus subtilis]
MNAKEIKTFKKHCKVGDELSFIISSKGNDSKHYAGIITDITETKVCLKNIVDMDLYDALNHPETLEIYLSTIYCFWNRTNGFGLEID